jgi:two-component system cell cycle response regulator DivK
MVTMHSNPSPEHREVDPAEGFVRGELKGKTALIVEDTASNYGLISRMLEHMGARCLWKTSGREVTEFIRTSGNVDLIFMDLRLPYEDGYAALGRIRATQELRDIPVVAVTAYASEEEMRRSYRAGFDGFLGKPLEPDRFPSQVRRILSGKPVWDLE